MAGLAGGQLRFARNRLTTGSVERFGREPSAAKIGEVAISQMKSGECGEPHFRELEPYWRMAQTG